jgi:hypothetical protein
MLLGNFKYTNPEFKDFEDFEYEMVDSDYIFFTPKKYEFVAFFYRVNCQFPENNFIKKYKYKKNFINNDFLN